MIQFEAWLTTEGLFIEVHPFFHGLALISLSNLVDNIICFQLPEQKWEIQLYKPIPVFNSNKK